MKELKEYETRWIAARQEYKRECSFFQKLRWGLMKKRLLDTDEGILIMNGAKIRLSEAAKKYQIEERLYYTASNPSPVERKEKLESIIQQLSEIVQGVRLPKEIEEDTKKARFGKDLDKMMVEAQRGVELARKAKKTGKSIEELASTLQDFGMMEPELASLIEADKDAGRPENVDWMGLSKRKAPLRIEGGEYTKEDLRAMEEDPFAQSVVEETTSKDEEKKHEAADAND